MVVTDIEGVVKEVTPVPPVSGEPPLAAAYQSTVTLGPTVAERLTVPDPQRDAPVPIGAEGSVWMVTNAVSLTEQPVKVFVAVNV